MIRTDRNDTGASRFRPALAALTGVALVAAMVSAGAGTAAAAPAAKNGLRPNAPAPTVTVTGGTKGAVDKLVASSLSDLFVFYTGIFPKTFGKRFVAPKHFVSYDSRKKGTVCGESTLGFDNAFYASDCDMVAWDRGVMMPQLSNDVGTLGPVKVIAHEIGHDVQYQLGLPDNVDNIVAEQQADCYAGAYWKWVVDGKSKYFTIDQGDGLRQLLTGLLSARDPEMSEEELEAQSPEDAADIHGTGFDRAYAGVLGFTGGAARCNKINAAELNRRGQIEDALLNASAYEPGNVAVTAASVRAIASSLDTFFKATTKGYAKPRLAATKNGKSKCGATTLTGPVVYCAATNTVTYHLAELRTIATPKSDDSINGDFSAFTLLASRYALAARKASKLPTTGANAGRAALCYAGSWSSWLRTPRGDLQMSPWDLDKAVHQIVDSPQAATDALGKSAAIVTTRLAIFGYGVTHTVAQCTKLYGR